MIPKSNPAEDFNQQFSNSQNNWNNSNRVPVATLALMPHQIRPTANRTTWQVQSFQPGIVNHQRNNYQNIQMQQAAQAAQAAQAQAAQLQQQRAQQAFQLQQQHLQHQHSQNIQDNNNSFKIATNGSTIKNPLPPYAIATTNSSNLKKNRIEDNGVKKGFRNSRRRHRNSHLGCATCKSRRIKCDEQLKACRNCIRAGLTCAYLALDDAAIEALKSAQKAHAARIEALNSQESAREAGKQMIYPYYSDGLPTKIFQNQNQNPSIPFQQNDIHNVQLNLQRTSFQVYPNQMPIYPPPLHYQQQQPPPMQYQQFQPHHQPPPLVYNEQMYNQQLQNLPAYHSNQSSISSKSSKSSNEETFVTLRSFLTDKRFVSEMKVDSLSEVDGDNVNIVLDPECTKHMNKYWQTFDDDLKKKFDAGFESETLYKEYDWYHEALVKEAHNNIVLFKSFMSHGAVLISHSLKNEEAKKVAKHSLDRDFEIVLRFLNKFKINFISDTSDISNLYSNINLCFSKFQIYQTAVYTTVYGPHTFRDNVALSNRLFDFIISYLNNEFTAFLDQDVKQKYKDNILFERASLYNAYILIFIKYFAQCVKAYHTVPYNTIFVNELLSKLLDIKPILINHLSTEHLLQFNDLEEFLTNITEH